MDATKIKLFIRKFNDTRYDWMIIWPTKAKEESGSYFASESQAEKSARERIAKVTERK